MKTKYATHVTTCVLGAAMMFGSAADLTAAETMVDLGAASTFGALAGTTITNAPGADITVINGNIGVYPGDEVTGFPPGVVTGSIYAGTQEAEQAQVGLLAAYNDAASRSTAPITVAGNIGGQTLFPGLYRSTSSLAVSSGDLTLDAQGDPDAVYIFQIASTLTTTSGRKVILAGGAKASNIFWQVGTSATFGTTSVFKGVVLADVSITVNTGASLDGKALARSGAVTLSGGSKVAVNPTAAADWQIFQ